MTDKNFTYLALVSDRSGSMEMIRTDSEGGINSFAEEQKRLPGECHFKLVEFDADSGVYSIRLPEESTRIGWYNVVYNGPIQHFTRYKLRPRGGTALLDAIGKTVTEVGEELAMMDEDRRPGTVIIVVQTDGDENSSKEWNAKSIKALLEKQTDEFGWTFVFLGANQDAVTTGAQYGFAAHNSISYDASDVGTHAVYASAAAHVTTTRSGLRGAFTEEQRNEAAGN